MSSKFLLHGGATDLPTQENILFLKELVAKHNTEKKILFVYLAREEEKWSELEAKDVAKFSSFLNKKLEKSDYTIASGIKHTLSEQIKAADVVFIRGGLTLTLLEYFKQFSVEELKQLFANKTVGASSAGAYIFSKYYYSNSTNTIEEGLGLIPVKIVCHFEESLEDKIINLDQAGEKMPIFKIPEGKYEVYIHE